MHLFLFFSIIQGVSIETLTETKFSVFASTPSAMTEAKEMIDKLLEQDVSISLKTGFIDRNHIGLLDFNLLQTLSRFLYSASAACKQQSLRERCGKKLKIHPFTVNLEY